MKIGEEKEYFGKSYTAVYYNGMPSDIRPSDDDSMFDDPKCKICAVEPNYCKMQDECNGNVPFIFLKSEYVKAMSQI